MSSIYDQSSLCVTPNSKKAGKLYSLKGADLDVVRATTATYVGSDGLIKTALANEPRFDYTNGSCPSILVEPQRTNLISNSNLANNSSGFTKITGQSSPDGLNNASLLTEVALNDQKLVNSTAASILGNTTYAYSVFLKYNGIQNITINATDGISGFSKIFDVLNGVVVGNSTNTFIIPYPDGWYRCVIIRTTGASAVNGFVQINLGTYLGDGVKGFYWFGAQLEAGANATSYIPTVASTVTRNADVISKSGISSLIGQTEGTIFADVNLNKLPIQNQTALILGFNSTVDSVRIRFRPSIVEGVIFYNSSIVAQITHNISQTGRYKVALSYNNNYAALFVNGVKVGQDLTVSTQNLSSIGLGVFSSGFEHLNNSINSALVFPTQLTDQECIDLTTL